jgi:hypothetical protein
VAKWSALVAVLAIIAVLAATAVAATSTIGSLPAGSPTTCPNNDVIELGNASYVVPSGNWTLTSWSTRGGGVGGGNTDLVIYRHTTGTQYSVVGISNGSPGPAPGVLATHAASIAVRGGDILGGFVEDAGCYNAGTGTVGKLVSAFAPVAGDTIDFSGLSYSTTATSELAFVATLSGAGGSESGTHEGYCMPQPIQREDGTTGSFISLDAGQGETDPAYKGAVPAQYGQSYGITCDNLVARGYTDAGYKVDGTGAHTGTSGDLYGYFTKP